MSRRDAPPGSAPPHASLPFNIIRDAVKSRAFKAECSRRGIDGEKILALHYNDSPLRDIRNAIHAVRGMEQQLVAATRDLFARGEEDAAMNVMDALEVAQAFISVHTLHSGIRSELEGAAHSHGGEHWRDSEGRIVNVLRPEDRWATTGAPAPFSLGEFLRAAVVGARDDRIRAALSETTDSAGGYTVPDEVLREFIDAARAQSVCLQAGARTVPLTTERTTIAKVVSDPACAWRVENAAVAESEPTFGALTFRARSLAVLVKVSRELLDDSVNMHEMLTQVLAKAVAAELDRVTINGSGVSPQPTGIISTAGVGSLVTGGVMTTWDKFVDAHSTILGAGAEMPDAVVCQPSVWATAQKLKSTTNEPLPLPPALSGLRWFPTTAMVASTFLFGGFQEVYIGIRQGLRVEILRETFASNLQYGFLCHLRADVQVARPWHFAKLQIT